MFFILTNDPDDGNQKAIYSLLKSFSAAVQLVDFLYFVFHLFVVENLNFEI